jgi:hypothetical protein
VSSRQSPTLGQPTATSGPAALFSRVGQFTRNLTAPDPRARATKTAPSEFQVAASSPPVDLPVPSPREPFGEDLRSISLASSRPMLSQQPLQPLALTKIVEQKKTATRPALTPLPGEIQSRLTGASDSQSVQSRLRETRLRTVEAPKKPFSELVAVPIPCSLRLPEYVEAAAPAAQHATRPWVKNFLRSFRSSVSSENVGPCLQMRVTA